MTNSAPGRRTIRFRRAIEHEVPMWAKCSKNEVLVREAVRKLENKRSVEGLGTTRGWTLRVEKSRDAAFGNEASLVDGIKHRNEPRHHEGR